MPSIEIPFPLGEKLWTPSGYSRKPTPCPECAGNKTVVLLVGNGTPVKIPCAFCRYSYEGSLGYTEEYQWDRHPEPFICDDVKIDGKDDIWYIEKGKRMAKATELFRDIEDCKTYCTELNTRERIAHENSRVAYLQSKRHDVAWNASYKRRKIRDLKKELEILERQISEEENTNAPSS